jgi:predicted dehydrogenase
MRLALLGSDEDLKSLLRDIPANASISIVAAYEALERDLPLAALLPGVERSDNWESLLVRDDVDLVIVASPRTLLPTADGLDPKVRRLDQLKKLAQAGVHLLVSHPGVDLLDGYEVEMLRREGGGMIIPWFPTIAQDAWRELAEWLGSVSGEETAPALVHADWKRNVRGKFKHDVFDAVARDLMLMERLFGKLKRVTALGGPAIGSNETRQQDWLSLTVQIEAARGDVVRWSVLPGEPDSRADISFAGGGDEWRLSIPQSTDAGWAFVNRKGSTPIADWQPENEALGVSAYCDRLKKEPARFGEVWLEPCRSLETLAAVERSLQRGRTIELSQADQTEEHAFKGVMATSGCMLLLVMLFGVFVVSLVEGLQLPLRNWAVWRLWPLFMIVPLGIFLVTQLLQTVIEKPGRKSTSDSANAGSTQRPVDSPRE